MSNKQDKIVEALLLLGKQTKECANKIQEADPSISNLRAQRIIYFFEEFSTMVYAIESELQDTFKIADLFPMYAADCIREAAEENMSMDDLSLENFHKLYDALGEEEDPESLN